MKLTTICFTFLGLLTAVAALPLADFETRSTASEQALEERFVPDDDPIFARYFASTSEITERAYLDPDAPVEKRWVQMVVKAVAEGVKAIFNLIQGKINADKDMRGKWTSSMVSQFKQKYPHFNFVVCHTEHKTDFKGVKGKDWGHKHEELNVSFHKTIGYEIYWFKEGTFRRIGDGGYLNWAYIGTITKTTDGGKTVIFGKP